MQDFKFWGIEGTYTPPSSLDINGMSFTYTYWRWANGTGGTSISTMLNDISWKIIGVKKNVISWKIGGILSFDITWKVGLLEILSPTSWRIGGIFSSEIAWLIFNKISNDITWSIQQRIYHNYDLINSLSLEIYSTLRNLIQSIRFYDVKNSLLTGYTFSLINDFLEGNLE